MRTEMKQRRTNVMALRPGTVFEPGAREPSPHPAPLPEPGATQLERDLAWLYAQALSRAKLWRAREWIQGEMRRLAAPRPRG